MASAKLSAEAKLAKLRDLFARYKSASTDWQDATWTPDHAFCLTPKQHLEREIDALLKDA